MSENSGIEWTDATWNAVTGCTKVSPGCKNCYAERMSKRLLKMGSRRYRNGFEVTEHESVLNLPRTWKKPTVVFVNSMSDLFHEKVNQDFIKRTFEVMNECPRHTFQVLTKRPENALNMAHELNWTENIWMGTSVEKPEYFERIDILREIPAQIRFLSLEPLLEAMPEMNLDQIDWAIVGGESGPKSRPMSPQWVNDIRKQCQEQETMFFFKQWGGVNKKKTGRILNGTTYDARPPTQGEKLALATAEPSA